VQVFRCVPRSHQAQVESSLGLIDDGLQAIAEAVVRGERKVKVRSITGQSETKMVLLGVKCGEILPPLLRSHWAKGGHQRHPNCQQMFARRE